MTPAPSDDRYILGLPFLALVIFIFVCLGIELARGETLLRHPRGCPPVLFCGCGASVEIFGKPVRALFLSSAWLKFPRTYPKPNAVAVRAGRRTRGHVFVLKRHVGGDVWEVADYNSGKHRSRLHQRSIAGLAIVDPLAGR